MRWQNPLKAAPDKSRNQGGEQDPHQILDADTAAFWTRVNVTAHHQFTSVEDSISYLEWRNDQYFKYVPLIPFAGYDGKVVLDYGPGPGHDLVGLGLHSKPSRLIGMDISPSSLSETKSRLALHDIPAELILLQEGARTLPLPDDSVDHIHSSGVLHHVPDLPHILAEFRRILRPNGTANVMVYNYDSLFVHLYIAWQRQIIEGTFADLALREAFARSTDGVDCPIANVYTAAEFEELTRAAGFPLEFTGAAISMFEAGLAPKRFEAIQDRRLPVGSRRFLLDLEFDRHGLPTYRGHYAGIDGCFRLAAAPAGPA
jgi:ubiquinone/menaquinone biosynthesis C-methylase UbiE